MQTVTDSDEQLPLLLYGNIWPSEGWPIILHTLILGAPQFPDSLILVGQLFITNHGFCFISIPVIDEIKHNIATDIIIFIIIPFPVSSMVRVKTRRKKISVRKET